ncbi:MAG: thioredoxin [Clostridium sp.]|nr:thioredoxin [Clostridium sp.]
MALTITDQNAHELIESGQPVVIDFWATWCGPCMAMGPIVDELAEKYEGRVVIGKYNTEDNSDFSIENRIMSIPAFLFFKNGKNIRELRLAGSQSREQLTSNIEKLLEL